MMFASLGPLASNLGPWNFQSNHNLIWMPYTQQYNSFGQIAASNELCCCTTIRHHKWPWSVMFLSNHEQTKQQNFLFKPHMVFKVVSFLCGMKDGNQLWHSDWQEKCKLAYFTDLRFALFIASFIFMHRMRCPGNWVERLYLIQQGSFFCY